MLILALYFVLYSKPQIISTVKAPNTAQLNLLTSAGYNKKEKRKFSQLDKVIIILYLHTGQNEKYCLGI